MLRANRPIIAFFDAIKSLRVRQLALILKAGYDPNLMINSRGQNGLQFMINYFGATEAHFRLQVPINKSAYLSIAKLLLDSGLDPNAMDLLTDETVLFDAIRFNDREMVALLLGYVDLSLRNKNGETALMCAARFGSKQVVRLMLEHLRHLEMDGYFLRQRNRLGLTPLELARAENLEAAKVLTRHLIAYGQHTGAVLARSSSHHQLAAANRAASMMPYRGVAAGSMIAAGGPSGAVRRGAPVAVDHLLDDLSASDYDSDLGVGLTAAGAGGGRAVARGAPGVYSRHLMGPMGYDPKAAEFSAYLLEQQDLMAAAERGLEPSYAAARQIGGSDDDDFGPAANTAGGQLMRSRSCILGPTGGGGGGSSKQHSGGSKKASTGVASADQQASWQEERATAGGRL